MIKLFFVFTIIGLVSFGCTKIDNDTPPVKKVGVIDGSFEAQYGDISIAKDYSSPVATWNVWSMFRKDGSLVIGTEFINGSAAQQWWGNLANNPKGLPAGTPYSILIPDEDLRLVLEAQTKAGGQDVYLGIVDFNPNAVQFPLNVKGFRLGDYLGINADALFNLPGNPITIYVTFSVGMLDLPATKTKAYQLGSTFGFGDIIYKPVGMFDSYVHHITSANSTSTIYNGFNAKVTGDVIITIYETSSFSILYSTTVPAAKFGIPGKGTILKLTTTKVGWYDTTIGVTDNDTTVETIEIPINQ